ncbi:MAG: hypothetical protein EBV55_05815 [Burkholderiaceae bacterium]|nr:hypothetical protein [Burkholderiaceae bacterium]
MSEVSNPTTLTFPEEIPPVIVASLPKRVLPTPFNTLRVIVPVAPLKFTALTVVFALLTVPRFRPTPLIAAKNGEIDRAHFATHLAWKERQAQAATQGDLASQFMGKDTHP